MIHTVKIADVSYPICYNLAAVEFMEDAFGGLDEALRATGVSAAIKIFECLARAYEATHFDPAAEYPPLPSEGAYKAMLVGDYRRMKDACARCIAEDSAVTVEADPPEGAAEKNGGPLGR